MIVSLPKYVYTHRLLQPRKASEKRPKAGANQLICMIIVEHVAACHSVISIVNSKREVVAKV